MRTTPARISPATYPIAATATAPAYDFSPEPARSGTPAAHVKQAPEQVPPEQQFLFPPSLSQRRVIPFDLLTTPGERESIRARAANLLRPAPLKTGTVEVKRARPRKRDPENHDQRRLEFFGEEEVLAQPQWSIICDAPVGPPSLRMRAAAVDASIISLGWLAALAIFRYVAGGTLGSDRHALPFIFAALLTLPLFYELLWAFFGMDTFGMQRTGLRLVDFDGHPPSRARRYQRLFGCLISVLAAGMGLVWAFVDEDSLTWHDHMSGTFPTIVSET